MKTIQAVFLCFFAMQITATEQNPIFNAISQNDSQLIENMLQSDEYSNVINQEGQTILHAAVLANNWKVVKTILKSGQINVNQLDKDGKTAMDYAVEHGHNKMVRKLYKKHGKVTSVENAAYAKKIIVKPFKTLFYVGLSMMILGLTSYILCLFVSKPAIAPGCWSEPDPISALITLITFPLGLIFSITGASGLGHRSRKNLLLPTLA